MDIIAFDIHGKYGHFKKPYSTASPVTFPFPPTSAVLGMLGAVCGYAKDEYHQKIGWDKVKIGIQIINPVRKIKAGLNHINVKNNKKGWKFFCNRTHKPTNHEFLKDPGYRIYIARANPECMTRLEESLAGEKTVFTPCLGLSECLAVIDYKGKFSGQALPPAEYPVSSIVPEIHGRLKENNLSGKRVIRLRVPDRMNNQREVGRYVSVMYDDNLNPLLVETDQGVRVGEENIIFF
jgi:CRISPR-associated protein Cas5h